MSEVSEQQPMYSPHLKKVLKSYRTAAMTSLSGPNSCLGVWTANKLVGVDEPVAKPKGVPSNGGKKTAPPPPHDAPNAAAGCATANGDYDPFLAPPPFPIQQLPILTAPDQSRSERSETVLEGATISCFVVGGEKRLCLPQILNSVLRDFSLHQINAVCDELQIFCSRCNREQLDVLKVTGVLPFSAPSCGLITKTDAERLCSALLYRHPVILAQSEKKSNSLKVYHECFGKCKGLFSPDEYSSPGALCIECVECHGHFSPQKFVCHAHKALEKRTCHWGFDSANWRAYVLVAKDQPNMERLESQLDEMKGRYCDDYGNKYKRKQYEQEEKDLNKKVKYAEESASSAGYLPYMYDPVLAYWYSSASAPWSRVSAFRPWSPVVGKDGKPSMTHPMPQQTAFLRDSTIAQPLPPFLSQGPPVLLNPERVVPISETERFERHYQPNVALAPPSAQQVSQKLPAINCNAKMNAVDQREEKRAENKMLTINSEIEMSTDTDETLSDSTISAESSADYVPEGVTSDKCVEEMCRPSCDEEIEALRKMMEANNINSGTLEKVVREVEKLQKKHKEQLAIALNAKKSLQQEVEFLKISKKEKLREASEGKRHLRKQLEHTREEHAAQMKDALKVQEELRAQLEEARSNKETSPVIKVESGEKKAKKKEGRNKIRSSFGEEMTSTAERIIKVEVDASPSSSE